MNQLTEDELLQQQAMAKAIQIGHEAEAFVNSRLGQHVLDRAREQRQEVVENLICADPTDTKVVAELQGKAVLLGLFEEWLNQAITDGAQAAQMFKDYSD